MEPRVDRIRSLRLRAVESRAHRWRWRDRVKGQPFGALFRRSICEDPRWARGHIHWHRWLIQRREVDSLVGAALAAAGSRDRPASRGPVSEEQLGGSQLATRSSPEAQRDDRVAAGQRGERPCVGGGQRAPRPMTAAAIERAKARRHHAVIARAERWRWADRVGDDPWGPEFRRLARQDRRWARKVQHWHRHLIIRREFVDGMVAAAQGEAWQRQQRQRRGLRASAARVISGY